MPQLPPYVVAVDYVRVTAWVRGFPVEGVVLGWRGDRVYLTWKTEMGSHLGWLPAADVQRLDTRPPTAPDAPPAGVATPGYAAGRFTRHRARRG